MDIDVYCHFYCHQKSAVEVAVEFEIGSRKKIGSRKIVDGHTAVNRVVYNQFKDTIPKYTYVHVRYRS